MEYAVDWYYSFSKLSANCPRQLCRLKLRPTVSRICANSLFKKTQHVLHPSAIASTLQAQHATFVALASKTAALDAELQKVKALYTQLWRAKTGSMRDPFNELDQGNGTEFGLERLSGK